MPWLSAIEGAWLLVAALALALIVIALRALGRRWRASAKARRRARIALAGERAAIRLLERQGYQIEAVQPRRVYTISIDGAPVSIELRADLLVRRGKRRFVADAKTGDRASLITTAATRRQLLEYHVAYDVDGVLLVDMARARVHVVAFEPPASVS